MERVFIHGYILSTCSLNILLMLLVLSFFTLKAIIVLKGGGNMGWDWEPPKRRNLKLVVLSTFENAAVQTHLVNDFLFIHRPLAALGMILFYVV